VLGFYFCFRTLYLRDDIVTVGNCRKEVMSNAAVTEEEYFVAPQDNIPLIPRDSLLTEDENIERK
jgi:aspartyl-tRNA(Asn)/glutamyl-tRNA(Gln) amidotransferase subunit C